MTADKLSRYRAEARSAPLAGRAWRQVAAVRLRSLARQLEPQPVLQLG